MKHVLLSLCGKTPQILTETLYCMMVGTERPVQLDEVWIVTTKSGREHVLKHLLSRPGGKFYQFCRDYNIDSDAIRFTADHIIAPADLSDIQNFDNNESFANVLTEKVWNLTKEPNTTLHCSIAGGRKTMSAYLAMILQFFARPQDRLFHILTGSPDFENTPDFFYPPPQPRDIRTRDGRAANTADAGLVLVDIPFIRLRDKIVEFQTQYYSFSEMVEIAQKWITKPQYPQLIIDSKTDCVRIGNLYTIKLGRFQRMLYQHYAVNSLARPDHVAVENYTQYFEPGGKNTPEHVFQQLAKQYNAVYDTRTIIDWLRFQQEISKIKKEFARQAWDFSLLDYYLITRVGARGNSFYGIKLDKSYITILH